LTGRLLKKSEGLTRRAVAVAQLAAVPGISEDTADKLLGTHETLFAWIAAGGAEAGVLSETRIGGGKRGAGKGLGAGKGRRLGATAAARARAFLV
jgi:hypothetical protein